MVAPIPQVIKANLLSGGSNWSFPYYDFNESQIAQFEAAIPEMYGKGVRHVRITSSMNTWEDVAKTGKLREDRWTRIVKTLVLLIAANITPIVDVHNTGIRGDDDAGDWESDYMGDLRTPAVRVRHISLIKAIAVKIQSDTRLVNTTVLTPANEPIFWGGNTGEPSVWWNHQKALVPAVRLVAPDVVFTYCANDWNGIEAFVNGWDAQMKVFAQGDPRLIADVHFYEPMALSHDPNSGVSYPGDIDSWRGMEKWNKALLRERLKLVTDFAASKSLPLVLLSEYGTDKRIDRESRLRYLTDLADLCRELGMGHSLYTTSYGDSFQANEYGGYGDWRIFAAVFKPGTVVPPDDPPVDPPVDPPPTDPLSALQRTAVQKMITDALAAVPPTGGLTAAQVQVLIDAAIAAVPPGGGLTAAQVQVIVDAAIKAIPVVPRGQTKAQVEALITAAIPRIIVAVRNDLSTDLKPE